MKTLILYAGYPICRVALSRLAAVLLLLNCLATPPASAAAEQGLEGKAKEAATETAATLREAGRAATADAEQLWQRIDSARLKNRTRDEIVAWIIIGALVGAVAGMMTSLKPTGLGKLGRLLLGLAGAALGGILVRAARFDFGWGAVQVRYEELFFSFLGAILLLVLARFVSARFKKKNDAPR
jgi:uncharacterized membrane protein YeaQ/YmgE (transglycosylase-associated protein family)